MFDLPEVVDEEFFCGVVVKWVEELDAQHELVPLGPDVVDELLLLLTPVCAVLGLGDDESGLALWNDNGVVGSATLRVRRQPEDGARSLLVNQRHPFHQLSLLQLVQVRVLEDPNL